MKIEIKNEKCVFSAEYNPDWNSPAKKLGGKWNPSEKSWVFDPRDIDRVKELARKIYGTDGYQATGNLVTVQIKALKNDSEPTQGIYFCGKLLAGARGRDGGARVAENVIILSGDFGSGGSVKNWTTTVKKDTIVEIKNFPKLALDQSPEQDTWEIISVTEQQGDKKEALKIEREKLLQRLAEIEKELQK